MTKIKKSKLRFPSASAIEDCWQREATRVAIQGVRAVINGGAVPPLTPIGRLSDTELGWLVAAALFGWINTRARQATSNGIGPDKYLYINEAYFESDPWDTGAIEAILPELGTCTADWSKSLNNFSRDEIVAFLYDAFVLIRKAMAARDKGEERITRKAPPGTAMPEDTVDTAKDWNDSLQGI
jgi:hypothetical protein